MKHGCLDQEALARALSIGPSRAEQAHLEGCAACRAEWDAFRHAIEAARTLLAAAPTRERTESVRTAVLASMQPPARDAKHRRRRWLWLGAPLAVAAAAIVLVGVRPHASPPRAPRLHGTVHTSAGALVERVSLAPDEIVRLRDGTIDIEVDPLGPGERFRVIVGDAEVEVRGTHFEVAAERDRLRAVRVSRGKVDVRPAGRPMVTLEAGQAWGSELAATTVTPSTPAPAPVVAAVAPHKVSATRPSRPVELPPAPPPAPPPAKHEDELAYDAGWSAMRRSDFAGAATSFARTVALAQDPGLADDAAYWQAVALARAHRRDEAIEHFRSLLDGASRSAHHGEASAMLGWLLVDAHQLDEAKTRFEAAASDPSATAQSSGRAGLDALSHGHRR